MFGLKDTEITDLVASVTIEEAAATATERFARAAWTHLAEPGEKVTGVIISTLGAETALTALVERWGAEKLQDELTGAGADLVASGLEMEALTVDEIETALKAWYPRMDATGAKLAFKHAARAGVKLIVPGDTAWPARMENLGVLSPVALWVRGNVDALNTLEKSVTVTGARASTGYGDHMASDTTTGLIERGYSIVSGAAYGIDAAVFRAALAAEGTPVAFLAGGADRAYPHEHDSLLTRIAETGAVVSELPCGAQPTRFRFLKRNRLMAAASQATVIVEAGWRSGALNVASHAFAIGRPVGAVPGPVTSMASSGCHRLIKESGATLVTSAADIAELAGGE